MKRKVMVPCIFIYEDSGGRESLCKPTHDCNGNCSSCVWNSDEEKQHLVLKYPVLSSVIILVSLILPKICKILMVLFSVLTKKKFSLFVKVKDKIFALIPLIDFFFQEGHGS